MDAVRVFATLLILVIHADHWPFQQQGTDQAFWQGVDQLSRAALPLFVLLSGFLLAHRRQDQMPIGTFVRRRLGRSLLPWVAWMPVYTLVGLYLTFEIPQSVTGVTTWWKLGGGHLWYLILIPQLYVVYQLWPRGPRATAIAAAGALLLQTGLVLYRLYMPGDAPLNGLFLSYGYEFFFFWIGYFALGIALGAQSGEGWRRWPAWPFWLATAGGAALVLTVNVSSAANAIYAQGTGAFLRPDLPLLAVPLFLAVALTMEPVLATHSGIREWVRRVSRYSLGIYITHEALMYIPGRFFSLFLLQQHIPLSILGLVLLVAATLALAYGATRLIVASPLAITVGLPREPLRARQPKAAPSPAADA